ncbi:homoserine dehydrogenase [Eubacteriales bacterium OttesenSCG-928-K08]|nr:homoserine dehydrogenase [Eubacteriales bacterium OttesenSCG-928-K08]
MKKIYIALLGFGTVGAGVYRVVTENHALIEHREELDIEVKRILVKNFDSEPNINMAPREVFTTSIDDITNDPDISIVVECMGGVEPARTFILAALNGKKTVVTSNKEVISKHWYMFADTARKNEVGLYIEATVGGGIPLLRTVTDSLQANNIEQVMGIINGTTNFILTKMSEAGQDFGETLREAQELGYAEADPTADVEGFDATYKLSILSSLAFHTHMPIDVIHREGITKLTSEDFHAARQLGYEIKLLAIGKKTENRVEVRVHPTMIPKTHPLASVRESFNAVFIKGNAVDDVMLYGRGAGQMPTASAVMGDVIYACHHEGKHRLGTFRNIPDMDQGTILVRDWQSKYCIRTRVADQPGVLSKIAGVFAKHNVSLNSVLQFAQKEGEKGPIAWITFLTHTAQELAVQAAVEELNTLDCMESVESLIRVEE